MRRASCLSSQVHVRAALVIGLSIPIVLGGAGGDDTVKSTMAATAAQKQAFQDNAAKLGLIGWLKAKLLIDDNKLCQGQFKAEGIGGAVADAKTFFEGNGTVLEGVILEENYLKNDASTQILIVYQELLRACFGYLRVGPPGAGLAAGKPACKKTLTQAQKIANSAIDAAQDAQNRANVKSLLEPAGVNPAEWAAAKKEFCDGARAALDDSKSLKRAYELVALPAKGVNVAAPPAAPTPEQAYVLDGYRRMCRAQTLAQRALAAAGK